jgi:transposase
MIGSPVRVFLAVGPVDLRGAFDRLAAVTREVLREDPKSGALYLFVNRRRNRVKALWWDRNGYTLLYKRLARGVFKVPKMSDHATPYLEISATDFSRLIAGLSISGELPAGPTYH